VWSLAVAEHVCVVAPSVVTSWPGSHPVVDVMSPGCVIDHWMVTLLRYQPFWPWVPASAKLIEW
jgi:hypothetical protein